MLVLLNITTSTNEYVLKNFNNSNFKIAILSKEQTLGRGKWCYPWRSYYGCSALISLYLKIPLNNYKLSAISLIIGISICDSLVKAGVKGISIKWPNDIFYENGKIGGILIDSDLFSNKGALIVGIGLNLNGINDFRLNYYRYMPMPLRIRLKLFEALLVSNLLNDIIINVNIFEKLQDWRVYFYSKWNLYNLLMGRYLKILCLKCNALSIGMVVSLDISGYIIIKTYRYKEYKVINPNSSTIKILSSC